MYFLSLKSNGKKLNTRVGLDLLGSEILEGDMLGSMLGTVLGRAPLANCRHGGVGPLNCC